MTTQAPLREVDKRRLKGDDWEARQKKEAGFGRQKRGRVRVEKKNPAREGHQKRLKKNRGKKRRAVEP